MLSLAQLQQQQAPPGGEPASAKQSDNR